jgi:hypothetical protein
MVLVDGHAAGLQLRDALFVHVRADDFVSSFGQTCSRYQAYVATTNHRKTQAASPENRSLKYRWIVNRDAKLLL